MSKITTNLKEEMNEKTKVIDIGINLTHRAFRSHWREVINRAINAGVDKVILTGTSIKSSQKSLELAQTWYEETNSPNVYFTVGIHPHDAKEWNDQTSLQAMKTMLSHPFAVAVGECGLDYNRNFSSKDDQKNAFRQQLRLAFEMNMPLFLHEREAHDDLIQIIDDEFSTFVGKEDETMALPPIVIHCFTGTKEEALTYIERGYYIGFTGTICKQQRGEPLRKIIPLLPLDRLMVETDAPFMGFKKGRRSSEPMDCMDVARKLSETIEIPFITVCKTTTSNTMRFFRIPKDDV